MAERTLILIDGKNALYRFGYAHKALATSKGEPSGAVYGFIGCLLRLKRHMPSSRFVVVWDGEGDGWRKRAYSWYKGGRDTDAKVKALKAKLSPKTSTEALRKQLALLEEKQRDVSRIKIQETYIWTFLSAVGIPLASVLCVEADDLVSIIARKYKDTHQVVVYSSDKDFLQLLPEGIDVIRDVDKTAGLARETKRSVLRKMGCTPEQVLAVRALCGDVSDEIPNPIRGLGPKTAVKLVQAGVDPSRKTPVKGIPRPVKALPIAGRLWDAWKDARRNYGLMRLAQEPTDVAVSDRVVSEVRACLREVEQAIASPEPVEYEQMLKVVCGLELYEAFSNRRLLCRLQKI